MDKYEQMSDNELRRMVAERMGYTIHTKDDKFGRVEQLYSPDGKVIATVRRLQGDYWYALTNRAIELGQLPNWPQNADAALTLLQQLPGFTIHWTPDGYEVITPRVMFCPASAGHIDRGQELARTATIAFLRWLDVQEGGE